MQSPQHITAERIQELLYGSEGVSLDFKRDQYRFHGASDVDKSDLLKDVLAFANAFRRTDAHILIGVQEVEGGRAQVVGVDCHLKDAELQEFVNAKANRSVNVTYHAVDVEGQQVGVITIGPQQRPVYLKADYGFPADEPNSKPKQPRIRAGVVYYRLGSTNQPANPDDIYRMGTYDAAVSRPVPSLSVAFADGPRGISTGTTLETLHRQCVFDIGSVRTYRPTNSSSSWYETAAAFDYNEDYWRDGARYAAAHLAAHSIWFVVKNAGQQTATGVAIDLLFPEEPDIAIVADDDMPPAPHKDRFMAVTGNMVPINRKQPPVTTGWRGNQRLATIDIGKVQAGQQVFSEEALFFACEGDSRQFEVKATIRADELLTPVQQILTIKATVERHELTWPHLRNVITKMAHRADED